jgi:hypothetical protein
MRDFRDAWSVLCSAGGWLWWSWIASRWSGGGPRHRSYAHAVFASYVYRCHVGHWLRRRI